MREHGIILNYLGMIEVLKFMELAAGLLANVSEMLKSIFIAETHNILGLIQAVKKW